MDSTCTHYASALGASAPEPRIIAAFIESVHSVFATMVGHSIHVLEPHVRVPGSQYDVFGLIGFSGDLTGAVTIAFTSESAVKVVEAFTGAPAETGSPEFIDAVGELANMIAGCAKSKINLDARITIPSVLIGKGCQFQTISSITCVVIPCTSDLGNFAVKVCVKRDPSK